MSDNTSSPQCERRRIRYSWTTICVEHLPRLRSGWWSQSGLNRRPHACKARALPAELWPQAVPVAFAQAPARGLRMRSACRAEALKERRLVGLGRFELPTSRLSSARSNQLSYKPENGPDDRAIRFLKSADGSGSSMKKEKRRRRRPANGPDQSENWPARMFPRDPKEDT